MNLVIENYVIEKKELRGNAVTKLGKFRPEELTFSNNSITKRMTQKIWGMGATLEDVVSKTYSFGETESEYFIPDTFCIDTSNHSLQSILINVCTYNPSFESKLWGEVQLLLNENKKQKALYILFENLNAELQSSNNCDKFLSYVTHFDLSSDIIVHILNALSPIKEKLSQWDAFMVYAIKNLNEKVGEEKATRLLKRVVI